MIRGTTPTVTIAFPFAVNTMTNFMMYFNQGKDNILTKDESELVFDGNTVSATLTQEETYLFSPKKRLQVSARYKFSSGTVGAIKPNYLDVYDVDGNTDTVL